VMCLRVQWLACPLALLGRADELMAAQSCSSMCVYESSIAGQSIGSAGYLLGRADELMATQSCSSMCVYESSMAGQSIGSAKHLLG
jgi:hypothetical protein